MTATAKKKNVGARKRFTELAAFQHSTDHITVLMTSSEHSASKRFVKKRGVITKMDFNAGRWFGLLSPVEVHSIESLHEALTAIEAFPNMLVIRGDPIDSNHVGDRVLRRGDGSEDSCFQTPPQGRRWILIDFDKISMPKGLRLKKNPVAVCDYLTGLLPTEFHDVSYHWQLSSSAGVFNTTTVSMHIWFWLSHPIPDTVLKVWAKHVNDAAGYKLVDPALFQHVQAHYTAAPIFEGMENPFPVRSGMVEKASSNVDLVLPVASARPMRLAGRVQSKLSAASGFEAKLALIGDHQGGEGFHGPIVAAAASYVATHGAEGTDREALLEAIHQRVISADAHKHDPAYIADMASREHIESAIDSALLKFGAASKSKLHTDCAPHFTSDPISVAEATRRLKNLAKLV